MGSMFKVPPHLHPQSSGFEVPSQFGSGLQQPSQQRNNSTGPFVQSSTPQVAQSLQTSQASIRMPLFAVGRSRSSGPSVPKQGSCSGHNTLAIEDYAMWIGDERPVTANNSTNLAAQNASAVESQPLHEVPLVDLLGMDPVPMYGPTERIGSPEIPMFGYPEGPKQNP